ncbi:MAG: MOSC domain-containing protein [Nocardioides sp.]
MQITSLHRYPVKSMAGVGEAYLDIDAGGPAGDRRWAVVEAETGDKVTARELPGLLHLVAHTTEHGVGLRTVHGRTLAVPFPYDGRLVTVGFSRLSHALDAGDEAAELLSSELGRPLRLVWQASVTDRSIRLDLGGREGEALSLADAGPLLLTSESSLARLQEWLDTETRVGMSRFRPNVVVDGGEPFAEDTWDRVRLGDVDFRMQHACDRCVMTTIDPVTLDRGREPIRTLARHRSWDGAVWFGVWLVPLAPGRIHVGDDVGVEAGHALSTDAGPD